MREKRIVEIKVVTNADKEFNKGAKGAKGLAGGLTGVGAAAGVATGGIRSLNAALFASPIGALAGIIGGAVAAMRTIVTTSASFEYQMDRVAAVTGASAANLELFKKEAQRLGAATEYTATQVAELQVEFSKLGFGVQDIINATDATLDLATASGVDLATAAATTGASLNAFGLSTIETQRLMDVMAKSFSSSALDMSKFSTGISNAAASARVMGVSVEETVSAMSVLNNAGIDASKVGTDLRKIFTEVGKTTKADFRTSLDILAESMDKASTETDKMAVLTEAVGQRAAVAMSILIEKRDVLDTLTESYENAEGSLSKMADTMRDNFTTNAQKLKSAWEGLILAIDDGDGVINDFIDGTLDFLTRSLQYARDEWFKFNTLGVATTQNLLLKLEKGFINFRIHLIEASNAVGEFFGRDMDAVSLMNIDKLNIELGKIDQKINENNENAWEKYINLIAEAPKRVTKAVTKALDETGDAVEEAAEEENEIKITKEQQFMDKLRYMQEDFEDKTETAKIERRRQRHIAELENLKLTEEEKGKLRQSINEYYDNLIEANREKTSKYYADQIDAYDAEQAEKKRKREEEHQDKMIDLRDQALDSMARAFGEETAMFKAIHAFKTALKIKEILLEAGLIKTKAVATQAETAAEGTKEIAKNAGNPLKMALAVATVGAIVATSIKQMKKTKSAADQMASGVGGSAASGSSAPSFNVIGATSAGENLIASQVENANSKPVRAYVVEGEMTSMQEMSRKVKTAASI